MNEAGNEAHSITVALPEWRRDLDRMRSKHGADSPIGHRASNLLEQLKHYPLMTPGDHRDRLGKLISRSIAELSALNADHHHTPQGE